VSENSSAYLSVYLSVFLFFCLSAFAGVVMLNIVTLFVTAPDAEFEFNFEF
jgi:hypothetical protein